MARLLWQKAERELQTSELCRKDSRTRRESPGTQTWKQSDHKKNDRGTRLEYIKLKAIIECTVPCFLKARETLHKRKLRNAAGAAESECPVLQADLIKSTGGGESCGFGRSSHGFAPDSPDDKVIALEKSGRHLWHVIEPEESLVSRCGEAGTTRVRPLCSSLTETCPLNPPTRQNQTIRPVDIT